MSPGGSPFRRHPYEDVLLRVSQPQQYIGCEWNAREPDRSLPRITLVYPDTYELGMSNLGLSVVRHVLLASGGFDVRRAFCPACDMMSVMESEGLEWLDMEAGDPVRESRVIGFGVPGESLYTNYLKLITMAGLPLRAGERKPDDPVVLAGGGGLSNPLPLSPFTDVFFLGESEELVADLCGILCSGGARQERLRMASGIPGVWVPSLGRYPVEMQRVPRLESRWAPVDQLVPLAGISHDRAVVEVSRGCTRGCRFCQVSHITRPVRERPARESLGLLEEALRSTGWEKAGLLSLSISDHSEVAGLLTGAAELGRRLRTGIGQPSLRPDSLLLLPDSAKLSGRVTMAPEAGTDSLRRRINKPITDSEIVQAADRAFRLGAKGIKLYFMVGLPGETEDDLSGIGSLVGEIAGAARRHGRRPGRDVSVALSPFVPKPHTPFQWAPMIPLGEMRRRLALVRRKCGRVPVGWNDPGVSMLEGVLGLGDDDQVADMLEEAVAAGARFDAWTDLFRWDVWQRVLEGRPSVLERLTTGIGRDEELPWDFVDTGVRKEWLLGEWERAQAGEGLPDCRMGGCTGCGACGGDPVLPPGSVAGGKTPAPVEDGAVRAVLRITWAREGPARFSSHLDMVRMWTRAVRRAGLPVCYSKGYVTRPKLHFGPPLPLGFESTAECIDVLLTTVPGSAGTCDAVQGSLPEGFRVVRTVVLPPGTPPPDSGITLASYSVSGVDDPRSAAEALSREPGVSAAEPDAGGGIELTVGLGRGSRPDVLLDGLSIGYGTIRRTGLKREDHGT